MKALSIAWKDLQILFKDRNALILLFLLPMVFIFIFSGALGGLDQEAEDQRIPLPVVNLDPAGQTSQQLIEKIDAVGGVAVAPIEEATALAELRKTTDHQIDRALFIPADFSSSVAAGELVTLRLVNHPDASGTETEAVRLVIEGVAQDLSLETQLIASLERMADMQAANPQGSSVLSKERILGQARSQFATAEVTPLIDVARMEPGTVSQRQEPTPFGDVRIQVAGFTVLFVFLAAQTVARSIYDEKKVGSFRRLMAAPMSKFTMLVGKLLPNFLLALAQIAVIFAFGILVLPLFGLGRLTLGSQPAVLVLVSILVALCSSSLGILIAALARTESQIGGISALVLWGMGVLGGSFFPLYLMDDPFLKGIGRIVPVHWANEAYYNVLVRGQGLSAVAPEILALLAFTAAFFLIGLWRFDFD